MYASMLAVKTFTSKNPLQLWCKMGTKTASRKPKTVETQYCREIFRNVVKSRKNDTESTIQELGQTLPDYLEAKDIDLFSS